MTHLQIDPKILTILVFESHVLASGSTKLGGWMVAGNFVARVIILDGASLSWI